MQSLGLNNAKLPLGSINLATVKVRESQSESEREERESARAKSLYSIMLSVDYCYRSAAPWSRWRDSLCNALAEEQTNETNCCYTSSIFMLVVGW